MSTLPAQTQVRTVRIVSTVLGTNREFMTANTNMGAFTDEFGDDLNQLIPNGGGSILARGREDWIDSRESEIPFDENGIAYLFITPNKTASGNSGEEVLLAIEKESAMVKLRAAEELRTIADILVESVDSVVMKSIEDDEAELAAKRNAEVKANFEKINGIEGHINDTETVDIKAETQLVSSANVSELIGNLTKDIVKTCDMKSITNLKDNERVVGKVTLHKVSSTAKSE